MSFFSFCLSNSWDFDATQMDHAKTAQVHTKYSYGVRHFIQQSPTWISLITITAILQELIGNHSSFKAYRNWEDVDTPFKISDHIILCSRYQPDKYMEQCHTYCPAVCFLISDLFDIELIWTHQLSSDRARYIGQNKIIEGPRYQLLIQEGTDKLRLICLFYHSLNYTQKHVL